MARNQKDKSLLKHLQNERENDYKKKRSPSLVSLTEGDNNTVFKPFAFLTVIGTLISLVITATLSFNQFDTNMNDVIAKTNENTEMITELRVDFNENKDMLTEALQNNVKSTNVKLDSLDRRVTTLFNKTQNKNNINNSTFRQNIKELREDIESLRTKTNVLNTAQRDTELTIKDLENKLNILEVKFDSLN